MARRSADVGARRSPVAKPDGAGTYPAVRRALLDWYRAHARRLPFRGIRDPYPVLVSEMMLQQTRVQAMLPGYERFLRRFPDLGALAAAEADEVVAAWSGLGYYGRARNLHRIARITASQGLPTDSAALSRLPGVGPYTAAAVASIAGGEPVAAVDGNVSRVLARLFLVPGPSDKAPFRRRIRARADALMAAGDREDPDRGPGAWNQALMELGALVCVPARPRCDRCPVASFCRAFARERVGEFPRKPRKRPKTAVRIAHAVVRDRAGSVLLFRRRESPMRGLYDLPGGSCAVGERPRTAVAREARRLYGIEIRPTASLGGPYLHSVMDLRFRVFPFAADGPASAPRGGRFVPPAELDVVPVGSMVRKTLRLLARREESREIGASGDTLSVLHE